MRLIDTRLAGPLLIEGRVHPDDRGFFMETYRRNLVADLGIADEFVQDNHSRSSRGVLRSDWRNVRAASYRTRLPRPRRPDRSAIDCSESGATPPKDTHG